MDIVTPAVKRAVMTVTISIRCFKYATVVVRMVTALAEAGRAVAMAVTSTTTEW